jgi:hypothetical protein
MKHLARLLLVFLVALAIPAQGALAVAAGQCMALEHHDAADGGHGHASHSMDPHSHSGGSGTGHGGDDGGNAHCGPCTACCASASIAGPDALAVSSTASHAPYVFWQLPPIGVAPGGVDRPPLAL